MNRGFIYQNKAQLLNSSIGTIDSTVEVNIMDVEVQNSIHKITREGSGTDTFQRHNRIIEKFIDYIIASHDENVFQINGGM